MMTRFYQWLSEPEIIGHPDCPLIKRWTLIGDRKQGIYRWPLKLMVHYFVPGTDDPDPHDHPRSFVTLVLRGYYIDHSRTGSEGMRRGMIRYRHAEHAHTTTAGPDGCWTIVVMGPQRREWGFWRGETWMPFREYAERFGRGSQRCG
jgi:hypothetical protein